MSNPSTSEKRRFSGRSVILAGAILVFAVAGYVMVRIVQTTEPGPDRSEIPLRLGEPTPAVSFPPYLIFTPDTTLPRVVLDSLIAFAPGVSAKPYGPSEWLVDYGWLYLFTLPPRILTFAQMDSLAEAGMVNDDTSIGVAVLRTTVPAVNEKAARVRAISGRPAGVPTQLQQALETMVDTLDATSPPPP